MATASAAPGGRTGPGRLTDRDWLVSMAATAAIGVVVAVYLALRTRREWFLIDEWEFLANRVGPHPAVGILIPHNEHPSMIPILIWRVVFDRFGMLHYAPYMAVLLVFNLLAVAAVWLAARHAGAGPGGCAAVAAVLATAGVGSEDMIWAFQIGMVGSLVASWGGAVLTDRRRADHGPARLVVTWVVLLAGLACSAVSVPLLLLPLIVAGARRGWRAALLVISVPAVGFLVWYARWGRDGVSASKGFLPLQLSSYVITGLSSSLDGLTGVAGTAAVVVVLVVVATRFGALGTGDRALAAAGLACSVGLFAFISVGRAGFGDAQAQSNRYAYLTVGLVLPAAAAGLQTLLGNGRWRRQAGRVDRRARTLTWVAVGLCTVAVCGRGLGLLNSGIEGRLAIADQLRPLAAAGNVLVADGSPLLTEVGTGRYGGHLDGAALIRLHTLGELRGLPAPSAGDLARERMIFQFHWDHGMSRAAFLADPNPLPAPPVTRFVAPERSLNPVPVTVRPSAFGAPPTVVSGRAVPNPVDIPASKGCVSAAPSGGFTVLQFRPTLGAQAVFVLAGGTAAMRYGWSASGPVKASTPVVLAPATVGELTTIVGVGDLRLTSSQPLTVCPVS